MNGSAIAGSTWRPLRGVDPRRLSEARLQAHHAVQWLARVARAYLPSQPDDGHTNLVWDTALDSFVTHPMRDGTRLCLNVANLTLSWCDSKNTLPFPLNGHTDRQARQWLGERLSAQGLDANALDRPVPYALPAHALTQNASYDAVDSLDALVELAAWFANADVSLGRVQRQMTERNLVASDARCWPHHFDIAALISFPTRNGETGFVGAGLSPGDGYYNEPYFYVSAYPRPDPVTLPQLPALGHWHTHEFTAAVAPAHKIFANENQEAATDNFLKAAVDRAIEILK
jgi:hypothetical protein